MTRKVTAYCGLYCLDCIPSKKALFRTIEELEEMLRETKFEKYAEHKAKRSEVFKDYPKFLQVLKEIKKIECTVPCFEGPCSQLGCSRGCKVRTCALDNGYQGCWECSNYRECELLKPIKDFHPGLEQNLQMIRKYGLDNWVEKRGKHYNW